MCRACFSTGCRSAITCPPHVTVFCNEYTDPAHLGFPQITGCQPESLLDISFTDNQVSSFCNGDSLAFRVERTWETVDTFGNVTSCIQNIYAKRLDLSDIVFPPNYDGSDNPPLACDPLLTMEEITDTSRTGVPLAHGFNPGILACYIDVSFNDQIIPGCGASFTVLRDWMVFDICQNVFINETQTIEVVDDQPALFTVPDTIFVSTNNACGDFVTFPPINLVHECSGIIVSVVTPWGTLNSNGGEIPVPMQPAQ
ncbi:MAG: hypothetical protein ACE5FF_11915, partial [Saprospiraceae bacterium]